MSQGRTQASTPALGPLDLNTRPFGASIQPPLSPTALALKPKSETPPMRIPLRSYVFMVLANPISWMTKVGELGIYIDSDASMRTHVSKTVPICFAVLRQIRSIRRSVSQQVLRSLFTSLVLTRLDYGNATLAGLPSSQLNRLQSVINAAARLVLSARKSEHITPLLHDLRSRM